MNLISVYKIRLIFLVTKPIIFPRFPGPTIRGVLGHALKNTNQGLFKLLFAPSQQSGDNLKPYVLQMPQNTLLAYMPNDTFSFDMHFFGNAINEFSDFKPFECFSELPIGKQKGRLYFKEALNIISTKKEKIISGFDEAEAYQFPLITGNTDTFSIRFLSPVCIQKINHAKQLDFAIIIKRIDEKLIRLNAYTKKKYETNNELFEIAQQIATTKNKLTRYDVRHFQAIQDFKMAYKPSFLGTIGFTGNPKPFIKLLQLAELVQIGRGATSGLGHCKIEYFN